MFRSISFTIFVGAAGLLAACTANPLQRSSTAAPGRIQMGTEDQNHSTYRLSVGVDDRVELFTIIFRLADAGEFRRKPSTPYSEAVDKHFQPFARHPAVALARRLRAERGIGFNAVPDLAVLVGPVPGLVERVPLEGAADLDPRWEAASAREFLGFARAFAQVSDAAAFFESQRPTYATLERRLRALIANEADLTWVQTFYGGNFKDRFIVVPSILSGGGNYGPRVRLPDGSREIYAVLGTGMIDEDGKPTVSFNHAALLVHEFGHSFVNPVIYGHLDELKPVGEAMLETTRSAMQLQGYTEPGSVLHESIIRAGVARYKLAHDGQPVAERELERQRKLGFIWIDDVYQMLAEYEAERGAYSNFTAFYPRMKARLQSIAERLPQIATKFAPKVVSSAPLAGAKNVAPTITELRITFDRPMAESWGLNSNAPESALPDLTSLKLADSNRTLVIGVKLKPNTRYNLVFFGKGDPALRSAEGVALGPYNLRFATGPGTQKRRGIRR